MIKGEIPKFCQKSARKTFLESSKTRNKFVLILPLLSLVFIVGGALFFSAKLTGNTIGANSNSFTWTGAALTLIGLATTFLWLKKR